MFCDHCGAENRSRASYCETCGKALAVDEAGHAEAGAPERSPGGAGGSGTPDIPEDLRAALRPDYGIERVIGRGGMGVVYLAREAALDRVVALKVLPREYAADTQAVQRFLQEARLAAKLRHPNIVPIHAVGERGGLYFFTMDFVDGETLNRWVETRGPLVPREADAVILNIARAVGYAHSQGIVHRDLKPPNVMIEKAGRLFVMDFGIAKRSDGRGLTSAGIVLGTPHYLSPEQVEGKPATPRSDIYAIGLLHFFVLTGRSLAGGETLTEILASHVRGDHRALVEAEPRIPNETRPLLLAMIEKDPAKRIASCEEIVERIKKGAEVTGDIPSLVSYTETSSIPIPPAAPASPRPSSNLSPSPRPAKTPGRQQARERMKTLLDKLKKKEE